MNINKYSYMFGGEKLKDNIIILPCGLIGVDICYALDCQQGNNVGDLKDPKNLIEQCYNKLKKKQYRGGI